MFHLSQSFFPTIGEVIERKGNWSTLLHFNCNVVSGFVEFLLTLPVVAQERYWFAPTFRFSYLFRSSSKFWSKFFKFFKGNDCASTSLLSFTSTVSVFSLISTAETVCVLANINFPRMSPEAAAKQPLGLAEVLFWWSPVCHLQIWKDDVAFLVELLGCSLDTVSYNASCCWGSFYPSELILQGIGHLLDWL